MDILRRAVLQSKKIKLTYTNSSMGKQETNTRVIQPYGLVVKDSEWYLVAFCESKNDLRVFKCVRISEVTILEETFSIPLDFQLEAFWKKWKINFKQILSQVPFYPVTLKLLSLSKEDLSSMDIIEDTTIDNESQVSVNLYTYNNACKRIMEYGNTIEVLPPEELRNFIIKNAQELLTMYLGDKTSY